MVRKVLFVLVYVFLCLASVGAERFIVQVDSQRASNYNEVASARIVSSNIMVVEGVSEGELMNRGDVVYFEKDHRRNVSDFVSPWNYEVLGFNASEHGENFGEGIKIAVLDTGANFTLLDVENGYDFVNEDPDASDDYGHGTSVTQFMRYPGNNLPLTGAQVYAVKVLDNEGWGYDSDVIQGINWAIANDMDIISMSLGGEDDSFFLRQAVNAAYQEGILIVAAAGNGGRRFVLYPAAYDSVVAVGSVDENVQRSDFSNYGSELELVAPGEDIYTISGYVEGTSFSVPHVTSIAAGVLSRGFDENKTLRQVLQETALDLGAVGRDDFYGFGLVQFSSECSVGSCCDSLGFFMIEGSQPVGFNDSSFCLEGDIVNRNYFCTGNSSEEFYEDVVEDCGSGFICEGGTCVFEVLDIEGPKIFLIEPDNDKLFELDSKEDKINFSYTVSDDAEISNCTFEMFYYNGSIFGEEIITEFKSDISNGSTVSYEYKDFDEGDYSWDVECYDNSSNRGSVSDRDFSVSYPSPLCEFHIDLNGSVFNDRRVQFNISAREELERIEYIDYSDSRPRERRLCSRCDEYGFERLRLKSFRSGEHEVAVKCIAYDGEVQIKGMSFFTDSKEPRVSRTEPRRNYFTNGNDFMVRYTEDNVKSVNLYVGSLNESKVCLDGRNQECYFDFDLSGFNGQEVEYYFSVEDLAGNIDFSRATEVKVDTTSPVLNNPGSFWYQDGRYIYFTLNVTEENLDEINYVDNLDSRPRERRLCSRLRDGVCEKRKRFRSGEHDLTINIVDEAGNKVVENIQFSV